MSNQIVHELNPTPEFPRQSEGSFVTLKDGTILFAYSRFTTGGSDLAAADIAMIRSSDGGVTWSESELMIQNTGDMNVMSVSFLRLSDGRIAMFYCIKNGFHDLHAWMITSSDEAATWSEPRQVNRAPGYFVLNNDRVIQTSSGRLIVPVAYHRMKSEDPVDLEFFDGRGIALWYLSDDLGETWREAKDWWTLPVRASSGLQEPGVVELGNGRLMTYCRTGSGCQWAMESGDDGETWSAPQPTRFMSPNSPLCIKPIPGTDRFLAIWNDHSGRYPFPEKTPVSSERLPLVSAIGDQQTGQHWIGHRIIDDEEGCGFCYTAIHFVDDPDDGQQVLLAYCAGNVVESKNILNRLRVRRVSLDWFMERC